MTRLAQILIAVLAVVGLSAAAYAVGTATSYDDPPPARDIVVDELAATPTPSTPSDGSPSSAPSSSPSRTPADEVKVVTPSPRVVEDDDRGRGRGGDDDDADDRDDRGDDDDGDDDDGDDDD